MYVITVTFEPHPGQMDAFLPLMLENATRSLEDEAGCHRFDVCLSEDRDRVFLYELYTDKAAFGRHVETSHFKSFDAAVADMVLNKSVQSYELI